MLSYIARRILLFIPTLLVISLVAFIISISAPGDPVDRLLNISETSSGISQHSALSRRIREEKRRQLGLDLPVFYFSFGTLADVDTAYRIPEGNERELVQRLARQYGNPEKVMAYYSLLKKAQSQAGEFHADSPVEEKDPALTAVNLWANSLYNLLRHTPKEATEANLAMMTQLAGEHASLRPLSPLLNAVKARYAEMLQNATPWKTYIPAIYWHGLKNQYHHWLLGLVTKADFGLSYRDQQPVVKRIKDKLLWSFVLTLLSVIIAYMVSIPLGVYSARRSGSFLDQASTVAVFMLYSLPNFFVGAMLLVFFANPDFLNWFPAAGVQDPLSFNPDWPLYQKIIHWMPFLVLPLITYTYASFAFLSRQMRAGIKEVLQQDFIRTARAKGLPERKVIWKHAFRNAMLPIITVFASVFPMAISGSIIVETIFSIPGMGLEIYESILSYDYPMIVAIFTIFGVLTLFGYLLADIMYAIADPRISFTKR